MFKSKTVWLVPVALSVIGLGVVAAPATAKTYTYNATFNGFSNRDIIPPDTNEIFFEGDSNDALLGLTKLNSLLYSQVNPITGTAILNTDPNVFSLQNKPGGSFVLFGNNGDKLFASVNSTGLVDFSAGTESLSGIVNITSGEGRFTGANGTLSLSGSVIIDLQPNVPEPTQIIVNGTFTTVPEPSTLITLMSLGISGASVLLRRRYREQHEKVG